MALRSMVFMPSILAGVAVAGPHSAVDSTVLRPSLDCAAGLAFTPAELEQAVALRVPAGVTAARVVGGADADTVEVILDHKRRSVPLRGRRGGLAARWVALTVVNLMGSEVPPLLLPPATPITPAPASPPAARLIVAAFPALAIEARTGELLITGGLGASLRLYRGLRWTFDASYGGGPEKGVGEVKIALQALPLQSGPAFRFTRVPIELRLSALVVPYWVRATQTEQTAAHQGAVGGLTAAGLAYLPLHRHLLAMVAVGVDLFVNQAEFLAAGQFVFATPRFTIWTGAGLALRSSL